MDTIHLCSWATKAAPLTLDGCWLGQRGWLWPCGNRALHENEIPIGNSMAIIGLMDHASNSWWWRMVYEMPYMWHTHNLFQKISSQHVNSPDGNNLWLPTIQPWPGYVYAIAERIAICGLLGSVDGTFSSRGWSKTHGNCGGIRWMGWKMVDDQGRSNLNIDTYVCTYLYIFI